MKERMSKTDVEVICNYCKNICFTAKREYNRKTKHDTKLNVYFYCDNSCSCKFTMTKIYGQLRSEKMIICANKECSKQFQTLECDQIYCSKKMF